MDIPCVKIIIALFCFAARRGGNQICNTHAAIVMMVTDTVMPDTLTILNIDTVINQDLAKRTAKPSVIKNAWSWKKDKR